MDYNRKQSLSFLIWMISFLMIPAYLSAQEKTSFTIGNITYKVPQAYLEQPQEIPDFWISEIDPVTEFLYTVVKKGKIEIIGKSVSGRPIRAVTYGSPRGEKGTSTFSGSLGFRDFSVYNGTDTRKVYLSTAALHGGEFESPSHAFGKMNPKKEIVALTPDQLLDGQIFLHTEAMRFLGESGGLSQWLQ